MTAPAIPLTALQNQRAALYRDGIVSLPGCFQPSWADRLHEDSRRPFASLGATLAAQSAEVPSGTTLPCTPNRSAVSSI